MAIDLLNLQPTTISRDLKGKYILIYGQAKVGKTSFAANFKKNLLLAFEIGYHAIDGIYAQPVEKWTDLKAVLRQLNDPKVKEKFDTVTIDTASIAWDLCEKYICNQAGVQKIGEIPYGQGYTACKTEFDSVLRQITMMGYGIILIAHSEKRTETINGNEVEFFSPALNKRAYEICNRLVDVIGYIGMEWDKDGNSHRYLYTRQTPTVMAGSRYKYLAPKIEFGYNQLVNAIGDAIDKSVELDGAVVSDDTQLFSAEDIDYEAVKKEAMELWNKLVKPTSDHPDTEMAATILTKAEMHFGRKIKLSEITESQKDIFNELLLDMRKLDK